MTLFRIYESIGQILSIQEGETMKTILILTSLLLTAAAFGDWSENFDSYAAGSGIAGQGGWFCWEENPAYDAFVATTQARSAPHSIEIEPTSDVVQQVSKTSGDWEISAWCYIPSGSQGQQFFILLTKYDGGDSDWALQIRFNSTTGQLKAVEGTQFVDIIFNQWVEVKVEIYLAANLQHIYYNGNFIETIPWSPSSGIYEFDALNLFSNGGSSIYWDDIVLTEAQSLDASSWAGIKASFI